MRRYIPGLICVGVVLLGVTAIAVLMPRQVHDAPSGTWALVWTEDDLDLGFGIEGPEGLLHQFDDGQVTTWTKDGKVKPFTSKIHADPTKNPMEIDFIAESRDGRKWIARGIYRMTKDRLVLCTRVAKGDAAVNESERPFEFLAGKDLQLSIFERVEK